MLKPFDAILLNKAIHGGGTSVSGSISISANGTYDVSAFAEAIVNVSQTGADVVGAILTGQSIASYYNSSITSIAMSAVHSLYFDYLDLPEVDTIGSSAFTGATIKGINVPKASYIGANAFQLVNGLTSFSAPKCNFLSNSAFANVSSLETVYFPILANTRGSCIFASCINLQYADFPKVTNIVSRMFLACSNLSWASFPMAATIGTSAFQSCSKLMSVYFMSTSIASLSAAVFTGTPIAASTYTGTYGSIFVPSSLVSSYKVADNWSVYADRITAIV